MTALPASDGLSRPDLVLCITVFISRVSISFHGLDGLVGTHQHTGRTWSASAGAAVRRSLCLQSSCLRRTGCSWWPFRKKEGCVALFGRVGSARHGKRRTSTAISLVDIRRDDNISSAAARQDPLPGLFSQFKTRIHLSPHILATVNYRWAQGTLRRRFYIVLFVPF